MTDKAAITATFAGFKPPVASRRVVPLVFEVPIEEFQKAIHALGTPDAANPAWCAIARLTKTPAPAAVGGGEKRAGDCALDAAPARGGENSAAGRSEHPAQPDTTSSAPAADPNSKLAVLMTKSPRFRSWAYVKDEADADRLIKEICGISSKKELNVPGLAANKFKKLRSDYLAATDGL